MLSHSVCDFLNCVPVARRHGDPELLLDLAKVTNRFHLPTIKAENESAPDANYLNQPGPSRTDS